jgi:hypothetical protein
VRDHGLSRGGLLPDSSARLEAGDIARRLGLSCEVSRAQTRGRTETGAAMYEVLCREGGGYILISAPEERAVDCAALEPGPSGSACRLPGAADVTPAVRRYAALAGLTCGVDRGRVVGSMPGGGRIYEAGCQGRAGAWLTEGAGGGEAVDCLRVEARGDVCRLTTEAERLGSLAEWVTHGACAPRSHRYMGESEQDTLFEIGCRTGAAYVVRLDPGQVLREAIPCERAAAIRGGCLMAGRED